MMLSLDFIIWNADPELIMLFGRSIRWYGLLFALGFLLSQQIMYYIHKKEGKPVEDVDTLTVFLVIATIIGARLGHVFFYEPARYLANPVDIFKIWEGGLASHGAAIGILFALYIYSIYEIKIWLQLSFPFLKASAKRIKRENQNYLQVVDRIVIVVALTGCLIRFGNLMNSEIYGIPTESEAGVVYARNVTEALKADAPWVANVSYSPRQAEAPTNPELQPITIELELVEPNLSEEDVVLFIDNTVNRTLGYSSYIREHIYEPIDHNLDYSIGKIRGGYKVTINTFAIPRHPTQIYESLSYLAIFILLFLLWNRSKLETPAGRLLGIFLIVLWGARFMHEFLKENQVAFEDGLPLNMGQILSIPLILIGVFLVIRSSGASRSSQA